MIKRHITRIAVLLVVCFTSQGIKAQNAKKLEKSVQKLNYNKVISLSQRRIKKGMRDSVSYYYLTKGYLLKTQETGGNASERSFYQVTRQYEKYLKHTGKNNSAPDLNEDILFIGKGVYDLLPEKKVSRRKYYASFFAHHFQDTVSDYTSLFEEKSSAEILEVKEIGEDLDGNNNEGVVFKTNDLKYVFPKVKPSANKLVSSAEKALGTPWVWAGTEPGKGFDCSGFVIWAYGEFGYELPHRTKLLAKIGKPVSNQDVRESDLVCFGSADYSPQSVWHIGMVHSVEDDEIYVIHCATSIGVSIAPLHEGYWSGVDHFFVRIEE